MRAQVLALFDQGMPKDAIAIKLGIHPFQVSLAKALGGKMKPGTMLDYYKDWAAKHPGSSK